MHTCIVKTPRSWPEGKVLTWDDIRVFTRVKICFQQTSYCHSINVPTTITLVMLWNTNRYATTVSSLDIVCGIILLTICHACNGRLIRPHPSEARDCRGGEGLAHPTTIIQNIYFCFGSYTTFEIMCIFRSSYSLTFNRVIPRIAFLFIISGDGGYRY